MGSKVSKGRDSADYEFSYDQRFFYALCRGFDQRVFLFFLPLLTSVPLLSGIPPQTASPVLLVFFAACVAFGFCCLFGSLFVTMKYQSRMSDFNIYNVKQVYSCGMRHEAFESYYECHCSHASKASTLLFYAGTIMLLCATALLQFARWYFAYASLAASVVYVVVAGLGMLGLLGINFMMQTKTRALNSASDAEAAEEDARQMDRGQMGDVPIRRVLSSGGLIRGASRVKSGMRKRKAARTQSDREKQAFEEYVEKKVGKGEERPAQPQAFPPPPPPPAPAPSKLHEQSSVEIATAKDPGNLGNTLSETTRRKLFESQRNIHDAAAIDARVAFNDDSDRSSRLRPSELDVDMDEMFPKDERE